MPHDPGQQSTTLGLMQLWIPGYAGEMWRAKPGNTSDDQYLLVGDVDEMVRILLEKIREGLLAERAAFMAWYAMPSRVDTQEDGERQDDVRQRLLAAQETMDDLTVVKATVVKTA